MTGATGLIGRPLFEMLLRRGDEVIVFTRNPAVAAQSIPGAREYIHWDSEETGLWSKYLDGQDLVFHLAGEPLLGDLWDEEYKQKILSSREVGTRGLVRAIADAGMKPKHFISASAIGYYGSSPVKEFSEGDPSGEGFLAEICRRWEFEASQVEKYAVKRTSVRVGVVLDREEGALSKIMPFFERYLGGTIGDGEQWISWIHVLDTARIFLYVQEREITGVVNAVSPNPVTMKQLADAISGTINKPNFLSFPKAPIKAVIGEVSVPVTTGIKVIPAVLNKHGFKFDYNTIDEALGDLLN